MFNHSNVESTYRKSCKEWRAEGVEWGVFNWSVRLQHHRLCSIFLFILDILSFVHIHTYKNRWDGLSNGTGVPCRWRWALHPSSESSVLNLPKLLPHTCLHENTHLALFLSSLSLSLSPSQASTRINHYIKFPTWEEDEVKNVWYILQRPVSKLDSSFISFKIFVYLLFNSVIASWVF